MTCILFSNAMPMFQGNKFPGMLIIIIITDWSCIQAEPLRGFLEPDEPAVGTPTQAFSFLFLSPHFSAEPVRASTDATQFVCTSARAGS